MFEKLKDMEARYRELQTQAADSAVIKDQKKYIGLMQELSSLSEVVETFRHYKENEEQIMASNQLLEEEADMEL